MHEAGHACLAMAMGAPPKEMELYRGTLPEGRTSVPGLAQGPRQIVAAAGLAVEMMLYFDGRLVDSDAQPIGEALFRRQALSRTAIDDKTKYFGANLSGLGTGANGSDDEFMRTAQHVRKFFLRAEEIHRLAGELLEHGKLDAQTIESVIGHLAPPR